MIKINTDFLERVLIVLICTVISLTFIFKPKEEVKQEIDEKKYCNYLFDHIDEQKYNYKQYLKENFLPDVILVGILIIF